MASRKRTHLSIEKKVEVIKYTKDHSGIGVRALTESFGIGKMQAKEIAVCLGKADFEEPVAGFLNGRNTTM